MSLKKKSKIKFGRLPAKVKIRGHSFKVNKKLGRKLFVRKLAGGNKIKGGDRKFQLKKLKIKKKKIGGVFRKNKTPQVMPRKIEEAEKKQQGQFRSALKFI